MKETLKEQLARKDAEIESLKLELKVITEFYELWKQIAQGQQPQVISVSVPNPYPVYPWNPPYTFTCGSGVNLNSRINGLSLGEMIN